MKNKIVSIVVFGMLSGCAVTYTYEGQKYDSKEKFHQAVESSTAAMVAAVVPLPKPLTQKKLIFAMPSEAALIEESTKRFVKMQGTQPIGAAKEIIENIPKSTFRNIKVFYEGVQRKNIYSSVQFIEMQSMTGSFAASDDADALYMVEPAAGSAQWYYVSLKHGKQIFAYDRSAPTGTGKVQAFIEAVQTQAIRD